MAGPFDLLRRVVVVLDELDIPYALGGSLASSIIGEPRTTVDIDLAVALSLDDLEALRVALGDSFYVPVDLARSAIEQHGSFNVIDLLGGMKVDLFVLGEGILDRRQIERRFEITLPPGHFPLSVTSPEDQVLRKLDWYRLGGETSDRQWRDIIGILRIQGSGVDRDDLEQAAASVGLADLLADALREAGLGDR